MNYCLELIYLLRKRKLQVRVLRFKGYCHIERAREKKDTVTRRNACDNKLQVKGLRFKGYCHIERAREKRDSDKEKRVHATCLGLARKYTTAWLLARICRSEPTAALAATSQCVADFQWPPCSCMERTPDWDAGNKRDVQVFEQSENAEGSPNWAVGAQKHHIKHYYNTCRDLSLSKNRNLSLSKNRSVQTSGTATEEQQYTKR